LGAIKQSQFQRGRIRLLSIRCRKYAFTLSSSKWIETTNAIGLISKQGNNGGTFAHKDIAFEFATWISAEFKFYFIKEFQRLKADENDKLKLEWNLQRTLAKVNYQRKT
jgi:hypothetical protein